MTITMTKESYKKEGKKWMLTATETKEITETQYHRIIDAKHFFTNLGGYERHTKSYTSAGYLVTRINSISPGRENKSVYQFNIK